MSVIRDIKVDVNEGNFPIHVTCAVDFVPTWRGVSAQVRGRFLSTIACRTAGSCSKQRHLFIDHRMFVARGEGGNVNRGISLSTSPVLWISHPTEVYIHEYLSVFFHDSFQDSLPY